MVLARMTLCGTLLVLTGIWLTTTVSATSDPQKEAQEKCESLCEKLNKDSGNIIYEMTSEELQVEAKDSDTSTGTSCNTTIPCICTKIPMHILFIIGALVVLIIILVIVLILVMGCLVKAKKTTILMVKNTGQPVTMSQLQTSVEPVVQQGPPSQPPLPPTHDAEYSVLQQVAPSQPPLPPTHDAEYSVVQQRPPPQPLTNNAAYSTLQQGPPTQPPLPPIHDAEYSVVQQVAPSRPPLNNYADTEPTLSPNNAGYSFIQQVPAEPRYFELSTAHAAPLVHHNYEDIEEMRQKREDKAIGRIRRINTIN